MVAAQTGVFLMTNQSMTIINVIYHYKCDLYNTISMRHIMHELLYREHTSHCLGLHVLCPIYASGKSFDCFHSEIIILCQYCILLKHETVCVRCRQYYTPGVSNCIGNVQTEGNAICSFFHSSANISHPALTVQFTKTTVTFDDTLTISLMPIYYLSN